MSSPTLFNSSSTEKAFKSIKPIDQSKVVIARINTQEDLQKLIEMRQSGYAVTRLEINVAIPPRLFKGDTHIEEVVLGAGVTSIGESAFESCTNLKSVSLADGVK